MADEYLAQAVYNGLKAQAAVIGILAANIWNETAEQNPDYPLLTFDIIDEVPFGRSHDPGVAAFSEARVQIDIYALTRDEAEKIFTRLKGTWEHFVGNLGVTGYTSVSIRYSNRNPGATYQDEATLKNVVRRSLDFMIQY